MIGEYMNTNFHSTKHKLYVYDTLHWGTYILLELRKNHDLESESKNYLGTRYIIMHECYNAQWTIYGEGKLKIYIEPLLYNHSFLRKITNLASII